MANTIRIVNLAASPCAVTQFTDVIDPSEDRSGTLKTVNADDVPLTGLAALGVAAFVDGTAVGPETQELTADTTLVAADLVDGARNVILIDASGAGVTVVLPLTTTLTAGTEIWFIATNVANAVAVDDNAADTILGGAGPVALAAVGDTLRLVCDGVSDWTAA